MAFLVTSINMVQALEPHFGRLGVIAKSLSQTEGTTIRAHAIGHSPGVSYSSMSST